MTIKTKDLKGKRNHNRNHSRSGPRNNTRRRVRGPSIYTPGRYYKIGPRFYHADKGGSLRYVSQAEVQRLGLRPSTRNI